MNSPLRFSDEPCRHKLLDLIGDLGLCAKNGNPGLPTAHIVTFKVRVEMFSMWLFLYVMSRLCSLYNDKLHSVRNLLSNRGVCVLGKSSTSCGVCQCFITSHERKVRLFSQ